MASLPIEFSVLVEKKCWRCKRTKAPDLDLFPPLGLYACLCRDCAQLPEFALITKSEALQSFILRDSDLEANLQYLCRTNKRGKHPIKLFLKRQVQELASNKHGSIERINELREEKIQVRQSKRAKIQPNL